ncbi:uncharacterized protein LOC143152574 [Ptiloglossa arizonensis]|uniref:uncharacterized protein LOC143152574 n=1 Tax=Ptiloglossa arizonensis TaxID=3350558 RepID=UPI003FA146B5
MRPSRVCRLVVCAILCVCASSGNQTNVHDSRIDDDRRRDSRTTYADEFHQESGFERKLIPIKSPRSKQFVTMPLEPDAEILPAHYAGVESPGVDHMELRYAETQSLSTVPESRNTGQAKGSQQVSKKRKSEIEAGRGGRERTVSFEKGRKGDRLKKKKKTEYSEAGGRRKTNSEREDDSNGKEERVEGHDGSTYRKTGKGNVDTKAVGFRNVYHRDEYNKDHDFYDNDDHGGHSKKHGRYNEKHIAIEGTFEKGGDKGSGFEQEALRKQATGKNSQAERESKGHDARRGYDGFFKNFQGFAKQAGGNEGEKFGFVVAKAR